ncbi:CP family cyanate transporter-like MFS transporter [Paenibacillus sp. PastF-3]|uniref:CynX/NimT family MFS transporter n=1 Tax=unclassified Paenibacillus TaxID=185978 RepID=UPI00247338F9|nr:MFS transporter [Paenibacillus sp. PastF-3]MDH6372115.1 CP family cyanate transporter-like MFS transporter [Paenibacillus sp. PastF-3]
MHSPQTQDNKNLLYIILLISGIVLVAFNLRPAITSVGPLVGIIQEDVGLAHWSAGLLMSIPLISFAVMSSLVPRIAARLSNEKTLLLGLVILLVGICIRSISMTLFIFVGTLLIGVGIAIGNVLLPVVVKEKFPQKFGLMTSIYSTSMGLFASLASGISIPLAHGLKLGWDGALIVWGIPTIIAIVVWILLTRLNPAKDNVVKSVRISARQIWRSPLAWKIALFMGFQSSLFYITMSWLPEILYNYGISRGTAGWLLSFTQIVGVPVSFLVPILAGRLRSQVWIAFALGMCSIVGYGGLWMGSSYPMMILSIILIGIALGGNFPLALSYIGIRARNGNQAAELSGMAQSTGYMLAAIGPILIGYLYDMTQVWTIPLITLIVISGLVMTFGMLSGRDKYV